ncbi:hypothetical protein [Porphyromonas gulae]|uniref:PTS sugar transporter n=1 Tax=Porphyromonas gulae TaxID=111105 RepID=A0A0A2EXU8_9PORP|nr:hypothetical protein [Porphyromonas gulae]KGN83753.1 PTS sugar transporter [Porphyromonas gulae]
MTHYATVDDIARCKSIIEIELKKRNIALDSEQLDKLTVDIMNLIYAKGGSYSNETIQQFAKAYIIRFYNEKNFEESIGG